jgi:flavin reductase (DIM6/NTAB) family NADH-FMN oxidoreductase RutF
VAGSDDAFQQLAGELDYPMFVVTAVADGERSGCLVGFATQTSIHPPRFLTCVSKRNHTYRVALRASHLAVHVVPEDALELAEVFGGETGDEVDKLARCPWHEGPHGTALLDDAPTRFVGEVLWRHDAGDHDAFLLAPVWAEHAEGRGALGFQRAKGIHPGHEA